MGLDCRCSRFASDRLFDRRWLGQQGHHSQQQSFAGRDEQNCDAAKHHGFWLVIAATVYTGAVGTVRTAAGENTVA